ncbi:MAG: hypothetical protein IT578_11120 [Verrucomicrobiae bacterium]|nr:hypothetical protein [Verrucomicrobiae bacterium]
MRALARLADAWLAPCSPWMRLARQRIPKASPFSPAMTEACLRATFVGWTLPAVARWAHDDLPPLLRRRAGGGCVRGGRAGEVLIILPSTVFAAAWQAAATVWLAGGVPAFRPSRREPIFSELLAASARAVGGRDLPARVLHPGVLVRRRKRFRAAVVYGSDDTVRRIREGWEKEFRVFGFGPQVGAAWISRRALSRPSVRETACRLAQDVVLYDTQGCLSPACVFVERGGAMSPEAFAAFLEKEVARLDRALPSRVEDADARESFLQLWRFRASQRRARIFGRRVILHRERDSHPSGLRRTVFVRPVAGAAEAARLCARWPVRLAALAVADATDVPRARRAFQRFRNLWVTGIGVMQSPPPSWRNGGVNLLAELAAAGSRTMKNNPRTPTRRRRSKSSKR